MKVFLVVTHLLGTGHLARALNLAQAFSSAGHSVTLVSGGMPAPQLHHDDIRLIQLPPLRSDGVNFTNLLDDTGSPATDAQLQHRKEILVESLRNEHPDVVITELFPFGRRVLREEFTALLETAGGLCPRPLICSSVRDILAPPSKPAKATQTDALITMYYDLVLVHSERDITPLETSWPVSDTLRPKLAYTGYVAGPAAGPHPARAGSDEVIVSAGGGSVGRPLFETALLAARSDPDRTWRLLIGGVQANEMSQTLQSSAPPNVIAEPARQDFRQMLSHAAASVSLCGYNTALDILMAGTPAVFVPFDDGKETEQTLRAETLAHLDGISVLRTAALSPARLLDAVKAVTDAPARSPRKGLSDGAARAVACVREHRVAGK